MLNTNFGQFMVGNIEETEITHEDIEALDPVQFISLMKKIEEERKKDDDDRSEGFENISSYKPNDITVNLCGESAKALSEFLIKCHNADLKEEEVNYIKDSFNISTIFIKNAL